MLDPLLRTIVETPEFQRRTRGLLTTDGLSALMDYVAANPNAGELVVGTGGAKKLRWAVKGRGKSGGIRVITFTGGAGLPVFLLTALGKGEKINLTKAERNKLCKMLRGLVKEYRKE